MNKYSSAGDPKLCSTVGPVRPGSLGAPVYTRPSSIPMHEPPRPGAPENPVLALQVAKHLGLTPMERKRPPCAGYSCCCTCPDCSRRARGECKPRQVAPQPWEPRKAA